MGRVANAWAALMGRPAYATLPPARLLELEPDDRLLLECDRRLTPEQKRDLADYIGAWLSGSDANPAVLGCGIRLVAVRKRPNAG
jgi:hypothetical protein